MAQKMTYEEKIIYRERERIIALMNQIQKDKLEYCSLSVCQYMEELKDAILGNQEVNKCSVCGEDRTTYKCHLNRKEKSKKGWGRSYGY